MFALGWAWIIMYNDNQDNVLIHEQIKQIEAKYQLIRGVATMTKITQPWRSTC